MPQNDFCTDLLYFVLISLYHVIDQALLCLDWTQLKVSGLEQN